MDVLLSIEPQLALPVVGVVVFAILVYIFGFQQTQEPSYQHLAVLQSSGKSNKSSQNKPKPTTNHATSNGTKGTSAKGKEKALTNGHAHAVQGKEKAAAPAAKPEKGTNKENVKPQQETPKQAKKAKKAGGTENKGAEDVEGGDWIQAVSRKDKKPKPKKEEVVKVKKVEKIEKIEDVIAKMNKDKAKMEKALGEANTDSVGIVLKEVDTTQTVVEAVENKATSVESTPKKVNENKKAKKAAEVKVEETPKEEGKVEEVVVPEPVVTPTKGKGKIPAPAPDFATNVAFDELGGTDPWEEAKSRGAKKKRARKD